MKGLYLDIGGTHFRWRFESEAATDSGSFYTDENFLLNIEKLVEKYKPNRLGASFAGQVSDGKILSAPNVSATEVDFEKHFSDKYGIECKIDNDLKCAILAEASIRPSVKSMALLYIGTGLGGSFLEQGMVVRGMNNFAGEIGHIPFRKSTRVCGCGKNDCLELYCSGKALKTRMAKLGHSSVVLHDMLSSSDKDVKEIADDFVDGIYYAMRVAIMIFNPSLVIFGGGIIKNNVNLIDDLGRNASGLSFESAKDFVDVEISSFDDAAVDGCKLLFD